MAKEVKKDETQEVNVTVEAQETEQQPEQKEQEKKTWKQKRAEKKAQFKQDHPVAAKRIEVAKTVTIGAAAGFLVKTGIDLISNAIGGRSGSTGNSDVIDTTYTDVTNNNSNN